MATGRRVHLETVCALGSGARDHGARVRGALGCALSDASALGACDELTVLHTTGVAAVVPRGAAAGDGWRQTHTCTLCSVRREGGVMTG